MITKRSFIFLSLVGATGACSQHENLIPCETRLSNFTLNNKNSLKLILEKIVPLGSNPKCAQIVMNSDRFKLLLDKKDKKQYRHIRYTEHYNDRLKNIFMLGYDRVDVSFKYTDEKLQQIRVF